MTRAMRLGKHLISGTVSMKTDKKEKRLSTMAKSFPLHCWLLVVCTLWCMSPCVISLFFALADRGGAFPPALLLQQLDAVVDVKLDRPPVSLVTDQQGAEFEAAFTVCLCRNAQLHEVSLQVSLHCYTLRLWPGSLQHSTLPCEKKRR